MACHEFLVIVPKKKGSVVKEVLESGLIEKQYLKP